MARKKRQGKKIYPPTKSLLFSSSQLVNILQDRVSNVSDTDILSLFAETIFGLDPGDVIFDQEARKYIVFLSADESPEMLGFPPSGYGAVSDHGGEIVEGIDIFNWKTLARSEYALREGT